MELSSIPDTVSTWFEIWPSNVFSLIVFMLSTLVNLNYYLGALNNNGVTSFYSRKECAFATIGSGLTDGEAALLYSSIQAFQTTLARQV